MYTKKILSTAATVALLSTGLLAFETNTNGDIKDGSTLGGYIGGTPATSELNVSTNQLGDALIFPYFKDNEGWKTEIVIRNTQPLATIAKVSLYNAKTSADIGDFNVYLSPYDVLRFTIEDGEVKTKDGSVPVEVVNPRYGANQDRATFIESGGEARSILKTTANLDSHEGYVVVYGMTQYQDDSKRELTKFGETQGLHYHGKHLELWKDYRRLLDDCRPNWRDAFSGKMLNGMMLNTVNAPDVNIGCAGNSESILAGDYDLNKFGEVKPDTLIGTVRVYKEDSEQSRDLLLPATALSNFSDNNMYLWSEGEYAAMQDRRISQPDGASKSKYDREEILNDSKTFLIKNVYYTFNSDDKANQLLFTQPMKKPLGQLFADNGTGTTPCSSRRGNYWYYDSNNATYGGFKLDYFLRDEDENKDMDSVGMETITSPHGEAGECLTYIDEMQKIENLQWNAANDAFKTINGFAYIDINDGQDDGIPAIVTQMVGSKVDGIAQTNWIYAPVVKK